MTITLPGRWCWTRLRPILWTLMLFAHLGSLARADESASTSFDEANKLYEKGQYAQAIEAYQALLRNDVHSAALYFNLGNAWFRSGQTGQAIAAYRLAQRLAPRDPDIRANLRFARESVGGNAPRTRWQRWLNVWTLEELTLTAAGLLWLWFGLLAVRYLRRDWARALRPYAYGAGLAALLASAWLALVAQARLSRAVAVVVAKQTPVRYGPFEESQAAFTLRDGAELIVLNRKDNWLQVTDGVRRLGWMEAKDVVILPQG